MSKNDLALQNTMPSLIFVGAPGEHSDPDAWEEVESPKYAQPIGWLYIGEGCYGLFEGLNDLYAQPIQLCEMGQAAE